MSKTADVGPGGLGSAAAGDLALTMADLDRADRTAEVSARNDAYFRDANERIDEFVQSVEGIGDEPLPFLCECADVGCTAIVRITGAEYEALRRNPVGFATVPGHESDEDWARLVSENERYAIVEKLGVAAEIAIDLDPRAEPDERA